MNGANIQARFGRDKLAANVANSDFLGFLNWTMLPYMKETWSATLEEICPALDGSRRTLFFDLDDPEKRTPEDIQRALELITAFEKYFDVILGHNEKESSEIGQTLGLNTSNR
jgi:hypothetical protein